MVCATLAITTLSAWRLKMSKVIAVWSASRSVIGWLRSTAGRSRAAAVPDAPLVDDELRAVLGIVFAHVRPVALDHASRAHALAEHVVPAPRVEPGDFFGYCGSRCSSAAKGHRPRCGRAALHGLEEARGPPEVEVARMAARARRPPGMAWADMPGTGSRNAGRAWRTRAASCRRRSPRTRCRRPSTSRRTAPGRRWQRARRRARRCRRERCSRSTQSWNSCGEPEPDVGGQVGFGAGQAAQAHELVNAELVGLGVIQTRRHAVSASSCRCAGARLRPMPSRQW